MAGRRPLSRPRTKLYDYNYSLGEQLYKPMVDRLDRKYSGRPAEDLESAMNRRPASLADEDPSRRRSLSSLLGEMNASSNHSTASQALAQLDEEDDFSSATLKRMRAARAGRSLTMDDGMEDHDSITSRLRRHQKLDLSDRLMDTVGLKTSELGDLESDSFFKRRTLRASSEENGLENGTMTKWTALKPEAARRALEAVSAADAQEEAAAALRAKKSRARIAEIENEMEELAERAAGRAGRRAMVSARLAEAAEVGDGSGSAVSSSSTSVRVKKTSIHQSASSEKKTVSF
ncbi:uncharacterized protein LOC124167505 [Ischnura elegans]|uniref:uncharacterized protein LOC124167505 n=1 Tax=Ischnura elegans TaxID=197161 RepID=UPI001ED885CB|nr:uncharacterized protein LOC124167505 [Ischnura elegans]